MFSGRLKCIQVNLILKYKGEIFRTVAGQGMTLTSTDFPFRMGKLIYQFWLEGALSESTRKGVTFFWGGAHSVGLASCHRPPAVSLWGVGLFFKLFWSPSLLITSINCYISIRRSCKECCNHIFIISHLRVRNLRRVRNGGVEVFLSLE